MKIFMSLLTNNQEIRSYLFNEDIYVSVDKSQQEIWSNLLMKIFMSVDKKINKK